jgi:hypothetical protein
MNLSRQSRILPSEDLRQFRLLIIGSGGIGSNLFHVAISTGITSIVLVDPDVVGGENIAPGWFLQDQVGVPKVDALTAQAEMLGVNGRGIRTFAMDLAGFADLVSQRPIPPFDMVVVATDNLATRTDAAILLWELCQGVWFDARMGGTAAETYIVPAGGDEPPEWYRQTLGHSVADLPCGEKATAPVTKGIIPARFGRVVAMMVRGLEIKAIKVLEDLTYHEPIILNMTAEGENE